MIGDRAREDHATTAAAMTNRSIDSESDAISLRADPFGRVVHRFPLAETATRRSLERKEEEGGSESPAPIVEVPALE